jgi:chaperonin GroEL
LKVVDALHDTTDNIDEKDGIDVIAKALKSPITQILTNAGLDSNEIIEVLQGHWDVDGGENLGYDAKNEEVVDMFQSGIIDPKKVTRIAIENAASVASMILTTECIVVNKPADKSQLIPQIPLM